MLETVRRPVKTVQHCKGKPLLQSRALRIDIQILLNSKEWKQEKTQEETERDKPMEQKDYSSKLWIKQLQTGDRRNDAQSLK